MYKNIRFPRILRQIIGQIFLIDTQSAGYIILGQEQISADTKNII